MKDGDHVVAGGCLFTRTPMALVREVLRQRRTGLTLSRNLMCTEGELMMAAGAAERVVTAWMSIGLPWGVSKVMRHYVETGKVALEEWSHLAFGLRFRAAGMGVPFLPALTMLGSDLMGVGGMKTIQDPYTGETLAAVPALFPDVALLHVSRADRFGNCQIDGYPHMDADMARAATTVIVTTEELVTEEEIRRRPDRTVIPGFVVDALVLQPFGAYPARGVGPLPCRLRALRRVHRRHRRPRRADGRRRLPRPLRPRAGDLRGLPGAVRRRAPQARPGRGARAGARVSSAHA